MSAPNGPLQDRSGPLVPLSTTQYIASLERVEPTDSCDCCGAHPGEYVTELVSPACLPCAMYGLGHDQAEEKLIRGMIGATIAVALSVGAGEELVRRALEDALAERTRVESKWMS